MRTCGPDGDSEATLLFLLGSKRSFCVPRQDGGEVDAGHGVGGASCFGPDILRQRTLLHSCCRFPTQTPHIARKTVCFCTVIHFTYDCDFTVHT